MSIKAHFSQKVSIEIADSVCGLKRKLIDPVVGNLKQQKLSPGTHIPTKVSGLAQIRKIREEEERLRREKEFEEEQIRLIEVEKLRKAKEEIEEAEKKKIRKIEEEKEKRLRDIREKRLRLSAAAAISNRNIN